MADLSDVEASLVGAVIAILYPEGTAAASLTGKPVRVYRGWPLIGPLGNDLAAGIANVSVFSTPGSTQNTTRWATLPSMSPGTPTLTVIVSGASARFEGVGGPNQVAGLLVANQPFVYRGRTGDTATLVAAMLAEAVQMKRACWLSGSTISVPGVTSIVARVVADGASVTEWARQIQGFRVSIWCPDPMTRDTLCSALGSALSSVTFLTLQDGTSGRIRYRSTASFDDDQDAQQYRRDLVYDIEYATTLQAVVPAMLFGDLIWSGTPIYG